MKKIQNVVNHLAFVIDASSSMGHLSDSVVSVVDNQIAHLRNVSREKDQETRVSIYVFADSVSCLVFDMDCLRMPSIKDFYQPYGWTALIDGAYKAIEDMNKIPELYGDSSKLVYVITDGAENRSRKSSVDLKRQISALAENWTLAVFVPDKTGQTYAEKCGFPKDNILIWDATSKQGVENIGKIIKDATDNYMVQRATGVKGTKNLFQLNADLSSRKVRDNLDSLAPEKYMMISVHKDTPIKEFVESWTKEPYVVGSGYYLLTKPEKVQAYKQVAIKNKQSGRVYVGSAARQMLGLPSHEVKVAPVATDAYDIFLQSTSVNRKLIGGTQVLVMK